MAVIAKNIKVTGLVQGVGFRPFIYKHALKYGVLGWVENRNDGVLIHAEANEDAIENFVVTLTKAAPAASSIASLTVTDNIINNYDRFFIKKSESISNEVTEISPDIAVCEDCLNDIRSQKHRINYPFTNCTNCGPRFTIINDLPYDRQKTTMETFIMCQDCEKEYTDIMDRRFHAQPVACNNCGPKYSMYYKDREITEFKEILSLTATLIDNGKIVSIKGIGGFFIACDAHNDATVDKLRKIKARELKPFAIMVANLNSAKKYAILNENEKKSISSWRRPIVLLKTKLNLSPRVCTGFDRTGIMLPYMPLHHLLFEFLKTDAIVLTSGNISDEPIIITNDEAKEKLLPISEALITYNREIYNRVDDSVEINIGGEQRLIRRARGYTPSPINLSFDGEGIFAAGAELVNCFCIGKKNQAFMSQHIGDIKNFRTYEFYTESIERFRKLFRLNVNMVVHDLHPEYFSTKFALEYGVESIAVQHHHAHIASCMAENGIDEKVIGIAMDGTGLGTDNKIWGSEFFVCDLFDFERISHFEYIPLPGGDKVTEEPWRTGVSILYKYYGKDFLKMEFDFLKNIPKEALNIVIAAIDHKLNCPESCSAGRLFDAVAAITNICPVSDFHAEAPMRLEAAMDIETENRYSIEVNECISFQKTIEGIVMDIQNGVSKSEISAKFHNTVIFSMMHMSQKIRKKTGLNKIVLSGGSFQNVYLQSKSEQLLRKEGFLVYSHNKIPANDGGLALGQLAIAAKRRNIKQS